MITFDFCVLTPAEHAIAESLDDDANYQVGGRAVDAVSPGTGINLNSGATNYPLGGETVTLVGNIVVPQRIIDDPDCATYCPDLRDYLMTMPWCTLDSEVIFLPPEDV